MRVVVHGDDIKALGPEKDSKWFHDAIGHTLKMTCRGVLGPVDSDMQSIRNLKRVTELTDEGVTDEVDNRHTDFVIRSLGFQKDSRTVSTPGAKDEVEEGSDDESSGMSSHSVYRALVARCKYLAQNRSGIEFAVIEIARGTSAPLNAQWNN